VVAGTRSFTRRWFKHGFRGQPVQLPLPARSGRKDGHIIASRGEKYLFAHDRRLRTRRWRKPERVTVVGKSDRASAVR
jgi:hypothetical protein